MKVYGKNVALEVLKEENLVEKVYLAKYFSDKRIISMIENLKLKPVILDKNDLMKFDKYNHQGIILDIKDFIYCDLNSLLKYDKLLILDHIEDQHNLGAIIRTAEAAGLKGIVIPKDRAAEVTDTTIKTSAGTVFKMDIARVTNIARFIDDIKKEGFWITGTSLNAETDFKDVDYSGKMAIVIGNEGKGMSPLVESKCDYLVKIPMRGTTNSLNASVAAGIMIYEMIRE